MSTQLPYIQPRLGNKVKVIRNGVWVEVELGQTAREKAVQDREAAIKRGEEIVAEGLEQAIGKNYVPRKKTRRGGKRLKKGGKRS